MLSRETCAVLLKELEKLLDGRPMRFMEVCGTHTVSLFQSGLKALLPSSITHLSGPGCPVCVTHDSEIAAFLRLAEEKDVCIATFGDLLRVPGPNGMSLKHAKAKGADIAIVYSPLDALALAQKNPHKTVCFLGIGFETTAPTVAATILCAQERKISNFCVYALHKCVPPVLRALLADPNTHIDAFLLPGHVSTILGLKPYAFVAEEFGIPGVVGGFAPEEMLLALCMMAKAFVEKKPCIRNAYTKAVRPEGNPHARQCMEQVFEPANALWRGLGEIAESGLRIREPYALFDATKRFAMQTDYVPAPTGCRCGEILKGVLQPKECPLFGKRCTPANPVGPCMVSTEGSCAAWFKYGV